MKKVYRAPEIVFESFSLNVSIAADCAVETNATKGTCGYDMGWGMNVFFVGIAGCGIEITDETIENNPNTNTICYHNPTDDTRLFGS